MYRAVPGTSNLMYNFVALAEEPENRWLRELDVDDKNVKLARRREEHQRLLATGEFWKMGVAEKVGR